MGRARKRPQRRWPTWIPVSLAILTGLTVVALGPFACAIIVPLGFLVYLAFRRTEHPPFHCQNCGYDVTGIPSHVCPECGTIIDDPFLNRKPPGAPPGGS